MDLFTPVVPRERLHKHFRSILAPQYEPCRRLLQEWATGFPDRDGKFVQEFQLSFNSPLWELYLHATFRDYGFEFDWSHASPDFALSRDGATICVEAVTANSADGMPNEWDADYREFRELDLNKLNREAMIRLLNAIHGKHTKYLTSYRRLPHVAGRPFVLAVAPFEQPFFNHQFNRPIKAVLYDYYVDEEEYLTNPSAFPLGPRSKRLGFVEKANGAEVELGLFNDDRFKELSAIIFSCTATWGKLDALAPEIPLRTTIMRTVWGSEPHGRPIMRSGTPKEIGETITDGLQIYHNPYALYPLSPELLRRRGVVQVYPDHSACGWVEEETNRSLFFRLALSLTPFDDQDTQQAESDG